MITAIVSGKGGVGKTTIAVHLADWFCIHGCSVVLADCDPQQLSSRWIKAIESEVVVRDLRTPEEILEELPKLSEQYDVVVADAPGGMSDQTGAVLYVADNALIPTGYSYLDIQGSEWTIDTIKAIQKEREGLPQTGLIASMVDETYKTARNIERIARSISFGFVEAAIPRKTKIAQARGLLNEDNTTWASPPSLVWYLGRNKEVREAALRIDAVFQEIFAGACQADTERVLRLVTPKSKHQRLTKEAHGRKHTTGQ